MATATECGATLSTPKPGSSVRPLRAVSAVLQRCLLAVGLTLAVIGVAGQPSAIAAEDVGNFISALANQSLEMIRSNRTISEKIAYFHQVLRDDFDLVGISQFLLGPSWRVASETEPQEFQNVLVDYLVRSSGDRLGRLNPESLRVTGARAEPSPALVTSQLMPICRKGNNCYLAVSLESKPNGQDKS
jgi:ABC-type transporter MlaC component